MLTNRTYTQPRSLPTNVRPAASLTTLPMVRWSLIAFIINGLVDSLEIDELFFSPALREDRQIYCIYTGTRFVKPIIELEDLKTNVFN